MSDIKAYMDFFKEKDGYTELVDDFVKDHRQKAGGYIDLATAFEFYNYLKDNIGEIKKLTGLTEEEILKPGKEPSQKWHLMVSYLGMLYWKEKPPFFSRVTCPELWLWMFGVSKIFTNEEMTVIYEKAKYYFENKKERKKDWDQIRKKYQEKLEEKVYK